MVLKYLYYKFYKLFFQIETCPVGPGPLNVITNNVISQITLSVLGCFSKSHFLMPMKKDLG
jgi:hypothetical protein